MHINRMTNDIMTIDDFLSHQECQIFIDDGERAGFEEASIMTSHGAVMNSHARNNDRVIFDDPALAASLWQRLAPFIDDPFNDAWQPIGLNERMRFYRYDAGQKFDWHVDGCFARDDDELSLLTFMIYLNSATDGGETLFAEHVTGLAFHPPVSHRIKTVAGRAVMFRHDILHKGDMVREGRKYVLRSDVMFRRLGR